MGQRRQQRRTSLGVGCAAALQSTLAVLLVAWAVAGHAVPDPGVTGELDGATAGAAVGPFRVLATERFISVALDVLGGSISIGGFAVVIYTVSRLMMMTRAVMRMLGTSYRASATASHLLEFPRLDEGRPPGASAVVASAGNLTAREVAFAYLGSERDAVGEVDLEVHRGTTLALVGPTAPARPPWPSCCSGCTSQLPDRWSEAAPIRGRRPRPRYGPALRRCSRTTKRYQMSLRDNVILADIGAAGDEERLLRALREGGVPDELWQGPDGLDVMLSREFGTRDLSLGQWQRLAIARGLFREHDTILLDEPTASIDPLEEQAVYERFMRIAAGRTAIIVTHRLGAAGRPHPGAGRRPRR